MTRYDFRTTRELYEDYTRKCGNQRVAPRLDIDEINVISLGSKSEEKFWAKVWEEHLTGTF